MTQQMGIIKNLVARLNERQEEKRQRKIPNEFQLFNNKPKTEIWY